MIIYRPYITDLASNLNPDASGTRSVGTEEIAWASGVFDNLRVNASPSSPLEVANKAYVDSQISPGGAITGEIKIWSTDTAPDGYLLCDGANVSRSTYSDLYGVIGDIYGDGDGSTTFSLPDLRGRTPLGQDNMGGVSANRVTDPTADTVGASGGAETGVGEHSHVLRQPAAAGTQTHQYIDYNSPPAWAAAPPATVDWPYTTGTQGPDLISTAGTTGGNMTPYLTITYIIKT